MKNKKKINFNWPTLSDKCERSLKVSPENKMIILQKWNEFLDKVLSDEQKIIRRKLREKRR